MIKVTFTPCLGAIASDEVWQYDYGQTLQIDGLGDFGPAVEVHFSVRKSGGTAKELVAVVGDSITVHVPDELLENKGTSRDYTIYAFVYPVGETSAETVARIAIPVRSRPKPEYYEADPEELRPFDDIVAAVAADAAAAAASAASAAAVEQAKEDAQAAATAAAGSATAASGSATSAAGSATAAAGSATTAGNKATEAAQSATAAAGSATTAGVLATAAQAAQTAAEAAQTAAETAQGAAEDAAESVEGKAAQIDQNTADISLVKSQLEAITDGYVPLNILPGHNYIDKNTGDVVASSGNYVATDFILCGNNDHLVISSASEFTYNAFYDATQNFISPSFTVPSGENSIPIPTGAKYFRLSFPSTLATSIKITLPEVVHVEQLDSDVNNLVDAFGASLVVHSAYLTDWTQGWIRTDGTDGDANVICRESGYHQYGNFSNALGVTFAVKNGYKIQLNEYSVSGGGFIGRVTNDYLSGNFSLSLNPDAFYRATIQKTDGSNLVYTSIPSDVLQVVTYQATDKALNQSDKSADAKAVGDCFKSINGRFVINLFDKNSSGCVQNAYLNTANGQTASLSGATVSDYIDVSAYSDIKVSYTHIICFYDADKAFIGCPSNMDSRNADLSLTIPDGVKYVRFSTFISIVDKAQLGTDINRDAYIPYGSFAMPGLVNQEDELYTQEIVVDANGGGDYTSLTLALKSNVDKYISIVVMPGTYDLVAEYNDIWGTSAVDDMSDGDYSVFDGFQFGIIIRNKKIRFMPGAKVVCDWQYKSDGVTERTVNGTHRFSPIRVDYDAEIVGLHLICNHTFYAVHDDYGLMDIPYTVQYKNCVIEAESLRQQNAIGGGCKKYSRHIIENCYFSNGEHSNIHTVRYHNTNQADAVPEIFVSDTYFNGTFTARWYGTQTTKMRVYVNNCKARAIYAMQEATGYDEENVTLYKWNNEETNPLT